MEPCACERACRRRRLAISSSPVWPVPRVAGVARDRKRPNPVHLGDVKLPHLGIAEAEPGQRPRFCLVVAGGPGELQRLLVQRESCAHLAALVVGAAKVGNPRLAQLVVTEGPCDLHGPLVVVDRLIGAAQPEVRRPDHAHAGLLEPRILELAEQGPVPLQHLGGITPGEQVLVVDPQEHMCSELVVVASQTEVELHQLRGDILDALVGVRRPPRLLEVVGTLLEQRQPGVRRSIGMPRIGRLSSGDGGQRGIPVLGRQLVVLAIAAHDLEVDQAVQDRSAVWPDDIGPEQVVDRLRADWGLVHGKGFDHTPGTLVEPAQCGSDKEGLDYVRRRMTSSLRQKVVEGRVPVGREDREQHLERERIPIGALARELQAVGRCVPESSGPIAVEAAEQVLGVGRRESLVQVELPLSDRLHIGEPPGSGRRLVRITLTR